jgi:two-component system OmpR family sensor kinase/two-component system sensor histidine kinase BaeS
MRNSLIYKLMGAFLLVVVISSLVISILLVNSTRIAFARFSNRSGQLLATRLAERLSDYYAYKGSWEGVGDFLSLEQWAGNSSGQGGMMQTGRMVSGSGVIAAMNLRLTLADQDGTIVADSNSQGLGSRLSRREQNAGIPIQVNGSRVGTLQAVSEGFGSLVAREFLASINSALVKSMLVAGVISLFLGFLLFNQITAPLRAMQKAAERIADGDLQTRVNVKSSDELGDLAVSFNNMAENLASAEDQRRQLAADVAHELRTPLAAIQATLEGMQDGVLPADQEQIGLLVSETVLLNRMVEDLRLLSLAEAGRLELDLQPVTPNDLIFKAVGLMQPVAKQQGVTLFTSPTGSLPQILGDTDRLTQVLTNLIANSLRYTPAGGTVTVAAAFPAASKKVDFSVTDTGAGIDPRDLPHVFDRFYRADKSRSRGSGGSGLGLAIVRQLVESHGGSVAAVSPVPTPDGRTIPGTRIIFSIPITQ